MTNGNESSGRSGRWQRRARRQRAEKARLQKHGATLRRVYADAVKKRLQQRKKRVIGELFKLFKLLTRRDILLKRLSD